MYTSIACSVVTLVLTLAPLANAHGVSASSSTGGAGAQRPTEFYASAGPALSGHWFQRETGSSQSDASFGVAGSFGVGAQLSRRVHSGVALAPSLALPAGLTDGDGDRLSPFSVFSLSVLWLNRIDFCSWSGLRVGVGPQWTRTLSNDWEIGRRSLVGIGGQFDLFLLPWDTNENVLVHNIKSHPEIGARFIASRTFGLSDGTISGHTALSGAIYWGFTWGALHNKSLFEGAKAKADAKAKAKAKAEADAKAKAEADAGPQ